MLDVSSSASVCLLGAGEAPVGLASLAPLEDVGLRAEDAVIAETTWAMLPADWADAIVAIVAFWVAKSAIVFLTCSTCGWDDSDTATFSLQPACFCSALGEGE